MEDTPKPHTIDSDLFIYFAYLLNLILFDIRVNLDISFNFDLDSATDAVFYSTVLFDEVQHQTRI